MNESQLHKDIYDGDNHNRSFFLPYSKRHNAPTCREPLYLDATQNEQSSVWFVSSQLAHSWRYSV